VKQGLSGIIKVFVSCASAVETCSKDSAAFAPVFASAENGLGTLKRKKILYESGNQATQNEHKVSQACPAEWAGTPPLGVNVSQ